MLLADALLALNKGRHAGRWTQPTWFKQYAASEAGRLVVQLTKEGTEAVMAAYRSRNSTKACYVLIDFHGDVRPENPICELWHEAVMAALHEWRFIYNARSKKASRPIWSADFSPADRTLDSLLFEPVRVLPHGPTYDTLLKMKNSRIFHIETGRDSGH